MSIHGQGGRTRGLGTPVPTSKPEPAKQRENKSYMMDPAEIDRMLAEKYPAKKLRLQKQA